MIRADNIIVKRGHRLLLTDLSFHLQSGQCLEIVGPNGCGKTSLLKLLSQQIQPFKGYIDYYLKDQKPLYLGIKSGFDPERSLWDNLCYLLALENFDQKNLLIILSQIQLLSFKDKPYNLLSAGQKQRVHLTRLVLWPRTCWLLDEPITSLDSEGEDFLRQSCYHHQKKGGAILIVTPKPLGIGEVIDVKIPNTHSFSFSEEQENF